MNITNNQNTKLHPAYISKQQFYYLLTCHICFCHATTPLMCPHCCKLYCESCIRRCLLLRQECPHCRKQIKSNISMTNCSRFVNQIVTIVNELVEEKGKEYICGEHGVVMQYFCYGCLEPVCCECHIFGKHKGHGLKRLGEIYGSRYEFLRDMLTEFKGRLKNKENALKSEEAELEGLKKEKEKGIKEIEELREGWRYRLIAENYAHAGAYLLVLGQIYGVLRNLNAIEEELSANADEAERNGTYILAEELLYRIYACLKQYLPKPQIPQSSILNYLIPEFRSYSLRIYNFLSSIKNSYIRSNTHNLDGCEYCLRVSQSEYANYLSIFLYQITTIHHEDTDRGYEYRIYLINFRNPLQSMVREGHAAFTNHLLGISKYIRLDSIPREGFLNSQGQIYIRYSLRRTGYFYVYSDRECYLNVVENYIAQQEKYIQMLYAMLQNGEQDNYHQVHYGSFLQMNSQEK